MIIKNNSDYKKAKDESKKNVATISHTEYKDVLLKKKMFDAFDE